MPELDILALVKQKQKVFKTIEPRKENRMVNRKLVYYQDRGNNSAKYYSFFY